MRIRFAASAEGAWRADSDSAQNFVSFFPSLLSIYFPSRTHERGAVARPKLGGFPSMPLATTDATGIWRRLSAIIINEAISLVACVAPCAFLGASSSASTGSAAPKLPQLPRDWAAHRHECEDRYERKSPGRRIVATTTSCSIRRRSAPLATEPAAMTLRL